MSLLNVHASSWQQLADVYRSSVVPMDIDDLSASFDADMACWDMGEAISVVHIRTSPVQMSRRASHIAQSNCDSLILGLNMSGRMYGSVAGSLCGLEGISASLLPIDAPWTVVIETDVEHLTVRLSRSALHLSDSMVNRGVMHAICSSNPYLRVLAGYLRSVEDSAGFLDQSASEFMGSVALELVTNMLLGLLDEKRTSMSADALALSMVQFIRENFTNPDLSVGPISSKFRVSERYVHRVFAEMNDTPSRMIQRFRIKRACELLGNSTMTVAGIAGAVGYLDISTFHRAFKREMGMSPKAWRERSQTATGPVAERPNVVLTAS